MSANQGNYYAHTNKRIIINQSIGKNKKAHELSQKKLKKKPTQFRKDMTAAKTRSNSGEVF